ncbi:MAG: FAD:protein FMN transferase [Prevotella sp.]|nr:FAD:protein FMN transferase [Prevotella sp.]
MQQPKNKKLLWQVPFLVLLIVGTVLIIRQQQNMPYQKSADKVFGTFYHAVYQCDSDLTYSINAELAKVDQALSPFNPNSVITAVNQNKEVKLNDMFTDVFNLAMDISKDTDGAFDITVAPLVNAWGFGFKSGIEPTKEQVDSLMQIIGYQKVTLEGGKIRKTDDRIMLDCSAIAKGYGTDVVARMLRSRGVNNFMIEIGGEIVTSGVNPDRKPWRVGISKPSDDPTGSDSGVQSIVNITDKAMATSGNYRNFYYKGGKKYAHTIDPKTGYPVQHNILSATVFAKSCSVADAYATSFMVMGLEKARQLLERHPELMAYLIYSDNDGNNAVWYSPSLKSKIQD